MPIPTEVTPAPPRLQASHRPPNITGRWALSWLVLAFDGLVEVCDRFVWLAFGAALAVTLHATFHQTLAAALAFMAACAACAGVAWVLRRQRRAAASRWLAANRTPAGN